MLLVVLALLAGCARPALIQEHSQQASFQLPGGLDVGSTLAVYPGPLDLPNRYLSNVIVLDTTSGIAEACSGVLVTPSEVLTAAHCTCPTRAITPSDKEKAGEQLGQAAPSGVNDEQKKLLATWKSDILSGASFIANGSSCSARPTVLVISYLGTPAGPAQTEHHVSAVHPHPRFLSLNDHRGLGLYREADLAIIHLKEPVTESFRQIKLPAADILLLSEHIVMVGYGRGETEYLKTAFGFRHVGESLVARLEQRASGGMRFSALEQPSDGGLPSRIQLGDSGGGGFSEADDTMLIGIVSASSEQYGSIFESVYPYRKWLEAEMKEL